MSRESDLRDLHDQAGRAYGQGRVSFIARFKSSGWGVKVGEMGEWEESLDAVESAGWVLESWTVTVDMGGTFNAFPIFRRRDTWSPQDSR